jgi:hypothetical protein
MWCRAFVFSLKVLRKSIYKLLVPALVLSLVMLLLNTVLANFFREYVYILFDGRGSLFVIAMSTGITALVLFMMYLILFHWAYPLLRSKVLFEGLKYLYPDALVSFSEIKPKMKTLLLLSRKRYFSQLGSFALIWILPLVAMILLVTPTTIPISISLVILAILYIACLIPVAKSYVKYFYADCKVLLGTEDVSTIRASSKNLSTCSNWKSILPWKIVLLLLYLGLLILLGYWMVTVQGMGSSFYTNELFSSSRYIRGDYLLVFSPFIYGFAATPFFSAFIPIPILFNVPHGFQLIGFWPIFIQVGFLLLLGLLTAFFFFVETLSTVYFFHQCLQKNDVEVSSSNSATAD